jgi:hypothetical protein
MLFSLTIFVFLYQKCIFKTNKTKFPNRKRKRSGIGNKTVSPEAGNTSSDEEEFPVRPVQWSQEDPKLVGSKIPDFVHPGLSQAEKETLQSAKKAYDFYKIFSPDSWLNDIVHQSRLYAVQKGRIKQLNMLTRDKIR